MTHAPTGETPAKRSLPYASALAIFLCVFLFGCADQRPSSNELHIYFTCDTRGRLEPCGCFTGQFGGLTRLKTVLDAEGDADGLRVDVGDAIGGAEDFDLIQYRYMLQAFATLQYDALNIGAREAAVSLPELRKIRETSPVPILSANLMDKTTGKPVFEPYRIVRRHGFSIAIVGVLDPRAVEDTLGDGLQIAPMEPVLTSLLGELRARADLIVLLAFADETALEKLAEQFFEPHLVLGGKVSQPAQAVKRVNRSLVYFVTNESRALGILKLKLAKNAAPELAHNEIFLLHDKIPQDELFTKMARDYRKEVRHAKLAVDDPENLAAGMIPGVRVSATYVGSEACLKCHPTAAAVWAKSGHAKAFATLVEREADADPKCIGCHAIGFGMVSGYRREFGGTRLVNTGCESCHGPGSLHVRQREGDATINFTYRPLGAGDCIKCHYGEFSRPFKWDEFWPPIRHGNERKDNARVGE
jgi:hypothetical protein